MYSFPSLEMFPTLFFIQRTPNLKTGSTDNFFCVYICVCVSKQFGNDTAPSDGCVDAVTEYEQNFELINNLIKRRSWLSCSFVYRFAFFVYFWAEIFFFFSSFTFISKSSAVLSFSYSFFIMTHACNILDYAARLKCHVWASGCICFRRKKGIFWRFMNEQMTIRNIFCNTEASPEEILI